MITITVKELKEILTQFDDNALIGLVGGEDTSSPLAELNIDIIKSQIAPLAGFTMESQLPPKD